MSWAISETPPPTESNSSFTNHHGEQWWCRVHEGSFYVWGTDVRPQVASTKTARPEKLPWVMTESESLWVQANLLVFEQHLKALV